MATVGGVPITAIEAHVQTRLQEFSRDATVTTTTQAYSDFTGSPCPRRSPRIPRRPAATIPDDCFQDINGNGTYDLDRGRGGMGGAEDVVRFRGANDLSAASFPVDLLLRLRAARRRSLRNTVLRNQPYAGRNTATPAISMLSRARPYLTRARRLRGAAARLRERPRVHRVRHVAAGRCVTLGLCGLETANLAMAHLRVSNIAMLTADNAARVRDSIDEANVIEMFTGAKMTGDSIRFRQNGRIILSSLEATDDDNDGNNGHGNNAGGCDPSNPGYGTTCGNQWIRWQRCDGARNTTSAYGPGRRASQPGCGGGPGQQRDLGAAGHRGDGGRGHLRLSAAHLELDLRPARSSATKAPSTCASGPTRRSRTSPVSAPRSAAPAINFRLEHSHPSYFDNTA